MDANNTPILKTPSTLRFITTSFLIVEIENSLREWRQSIRGDDPCQGKTSECHSKMRSSYSSKVESSCSKPANWPDERTGDAGVKHEGSGSAEGFARSEARAFDAAGGGAAVRGERSLGKKAA